MWAKTFINGILFCLRLSLLTIIPNQTIGSSPLEVVYNKIQLVIWIWFCFQLIINLVEMLKIDLKVSRRCMNKFKTKFWNKMRSTKSLQTRIKNILNFRMEIWFGFILEKIVFHLKNMLSLDQRLIVYLNWCNTLVGMLTKLSY